MTLQSRLARATPYVYIAPAVIIMAAGLLFPILKAGQLAFFDWGMGTPWDSANGSAWKPSAKCSRMARSGPRWA